MKLLENLPKMLRLGLLEENPLFFCFAFLCPALTASSNAGDGVRLGLTITFVLTCSGACIAALGRFLSGWRRFMCAAVVCAFFVSLADLFLRAYQPEFAVSMGVFIPLLAVGCITLLLSGFGSEGGELAGAVQGLFMGLGAVLALFLAGTLRNVLVNGMASWLVVGERTPGFAFFATPAGAFIVLGITAGLLRAVSQARLPARQKAAAAPEFVSVPESEPAQDEIPAESDDIDEILDEFSESPDEPDAKGDTI